MASRKLIGIIGAGKADQQTLKSAELIGRLIASRGAVLVSGGLSGVMEAASRGAKAEGGITVGILPQNSREVNDYIDIPISTGFGEGRNVILVRTSDALICLAGGYGTLSEIAFALKMGKPVVGFRSWTVPGVVPSESESDAVEKAFNLSSNLKIRS